MSKFNVGDKVIFMNADKYEADCKFYPAVGTAGIVKELGTGDLLVDWGDAEGVDIGLDGTKSWWCSEFDVKLYHYTNDEVWGMLKPKMSQLALPRQNIDYFSQEIKNMIVAAYRSGYGRATKGRSFMIKPKVKKAIEKVNIEDSIDAVLEDKMIVTVYTDIGNSYLVSKFDHALNGEQGMEIHGDIIYNSDGGTWDNGFDVIGDPDCEMYVVVPFSEVVGEFDSKSIRALYCGDKLMALSDFKPWTIGEFNGFMRVSNENETCALMKFKHEDSNSLFYPEIHKPEFKALVPLCEYLRVNGVNV